jgi:hypothetical protein
MTDEEIKIKQLFTYHPPTEADKVKHKKLIEAHTACHNVYNLVMFDSRGAELTWPTLFKRIAEATKAFALIVNDVAPGSADKSAAIRCLRLARMAANEALLAQRHGEASEAAHFMVMATDELFKARWQASAAIALDTVLAEVG